MQAMANSTPTISLLMLEAVGGGRLGGRRSRRCPKRCAIAGVDGGRAMLRPDPSGYRRRGCCRPGGCCRRRPGPGSRAEDGMLAVQPGRRHVGDEELAARGRASALAMLRTPGPSWRRSAWNSSMKGVARATAAGAGGVAAWDHEVRKHAVEAGAVVIAFLGQEGEVVHGQRGLGGEAETGLRGGGGGEQRGTACRPPAAWPENSRIACSWECPSCVRDACCEGQSVHQAGWVGAGRASPTGR